MPYPASQVAKPNSQFSPEFDSGRNSKVESEQRLISEALSLFQSSSMPDKNEVNSEFLDMSPVRYQMMTAGAEGSERRQERVVKMLSSEIARNDSLDAVDKINLRNIELSAVGGNLKLLEETLRKLPDAQRAYLLSEAASDLKKHGCEIFQVRAASLANGGNVGDHDFVVSIRKNNITVEIHTDPRVPSATFWNSKYMPRVAVSDALPFPEKGSVDYLERENQAIKALDKMAAGESVF